MCCSRSWARASRSTPTRWLYPGGQAEYLDRFTAALDQAIAGGQVQDQRHIGMRDEDVGIGGLSSVARQIPRSFAIRISW
ncbi:hypothetical protein [Mycolicibacterium sarraceniae]|uniref:hypothetical protein n=1 Tax=Mycolicibacterium sarraceniae TaxID=1534348 RepID=UPI0013D4E056|nr:hypothetical protein [Mycolicibacterium sarraceniae]